MADSRRLVTIRLSLTDTTTRQVVWQARVHDQHFYQRRSAAISKNLGHTSVLLIN